MHFQYGLAVYASKCTICYYRWVSISVVHGETQLYVHVLKSYTYIGKLCAFAELS
jgi:hypothetical protein